jgi:hypothetical protein
VVAVEFRIQVQLSVLVVQGVVERAVSVMA